LNIEITPFLPDDIPPGQALTAGIGWPHSLEDWNYAAMLGKGYAARDPNGCLVGTCFSWEMGAEASSLGLLIVDARYQGKGLGRRLFERCMSDCQGRSVLLHATPVAAGLYQAAGFVTVGRIVQMQGKLRLAGGGPMQQGNQSRVSLVRELDRQGLETIVELDRQCCGVDRSGLLRALVGEAHYVVCGGNGHPGGFALSRRFGFGQVIGPVVAGSDADCEHMVRGLLDPLDGQFVRVDVPAGNPLVGVLSRAGLREAGYVEAMTYGDWPRPGGSRLIKAALLGHAFG
jgi:GNAT superfamily N-acetyltransferase